MSQLLAADPAPVEETFTCPVCGSGAVNVQGRFTCAECIWTQ